MEEVLPDRLPEEPPPPPPNVTPLNPPNRKRPPLVEQMLSRITFAGDVEAPTDAPYLIKGWLSPDSLAVLYGPANVGKSFLALNMAHHLSRGDGWGGCRVKGAPVLYVTLEGGAGFNRRLAALTDPNFHVLVFPLRMMVPQQHPAALADSVAMLAKDHGAFGLIIIDTLARAMAGGDENSAQDMSKLMSSADLIRERTGACIMLVHHIGKERGQGARGHSSLRAACDTEIEVWKEDDDDVIVAKATKQRDLEVGREFRYRLRQVELGRDSDGDPITTCIVERAAETGEPQRRAKVTGKAEIALQALNTALERHGVKRQGPDYPDRPSVTKTQWREAADLHGLTDDMTAETAKATFNRAVRDLSDKGLVRSFDGAWWLT
jgi:hypothetical protein